MVGICGDGQISRELMPISLNSGRGEIAEKRCNTCVFLRRMTSHDPEACPTNDSILGNSGRIRPVGQHARTERELAGFLKPCVSCRGFGVHRNFTRGKFGIPQVPTPAVNENLFLLPISQLLNMLHMERAIVRELGIQPPKAIGFGSNGHIMPCTEVLNVDPGDPCR